jgi:hypothetical protein
LLSPPFSLLVALTSLIYRIAAALGRGNDSPTKGPFQFEPLLTSAPCTPGGNAVQPFLLPVGYAQNIVASEPQFPDVPDMNTLNETGPHLSGTTLFVHAQHRDGDGLDKAVGISGS